MGEKGEVVSEELMFEVGAMLELAAEFVYYNEEEDGADHGALGNTASEVSRMSEKVISADSGCAVSEEVPDPPADEGVDLKFVESSENAAMVDTIECLGEVNEDSSSGGFLFVVDGPNECV